MIDQSTMVEIESTQVICGRTVHFIDVGKLKPWPFREARDQVDAIRKQLREKVL